MTAERPARMPESAGAPASFYVLEHKSCLHVAGAGSQRASLEAQQRMLAAGGYFRWRVRRVQPAELEAVIAKVLGDEKCSTCTVDVTRAHLPDVAEAARAAVAVEPQVVVVPRSDDDDVAIMPGACLPADVESLQQQTHDGLLEAISENGQTPLGPVEWKRWHGRDACTSTLRTLYADDSRPIKTFGLDQFQAFFDEHPRDCVLIVASCPVLQQVRP